MPCGWNIILAIQGLLCLYGAAVAHIFAAARAADDDEQPDELRDADYVRVQCPQKGHKTTSGDDSTDERYHGDEQKHAEEVDSAHHVNGGAI